ncbi:MAG: DUF5640 domain-containing protein [Candidatus Saccharibacteria bacterium]|nr:DUF5640 domain-containing protein [Candidatus Saccharibacteria bacterium]
MKRKQLISIIIFIIGLITLIAGVVFLILKLNSGAPIEDGEYLISVDSWIREDEPGVIWSFTEIGKGKLTTNNHLNDYDFIWTIEDGKIKIKTDWLYSLNDEYSYKIEDGNLILIRDDSSEIKFSPRSSVDSEVTENN